MEPKTLVPEVQSCGEIASLTSSLASSAAKARYLLSRVRSDCVVPEPAQESLRGLSEYSRLAGDAISAFLGVFSALRLAITSDNTALESDLSSIYDRYHHFVQLLDQIASLEAYNLQVLDNLEQHIVREFSHPPIIHFFIMRVLSSEVWSEREIALTEVPPLLDVIRAQVKAIAQLAVELRLYARALRERFSAAYLGEIKALPVEANGQVVPEPMHTTCAILRFLDFL
ncbi:hypothetical protein HDZ31DRAFT_66172 [Schizophyllum fasciatum]